MARLRGEAGAVLAPEHADRVLGLGDVRRSGNDVARLRRRIAALPERGVLLDFLDVVAIWPSFAVVTARGCAVTTTSPGSSRRAEEACRLHAGLHLASVSALVQSFLAPYPTLRAT